MPELHPVIDAIIPNLCGAPWKVAEVSPPTVIRLNREMDEAELGYVMAVVVMASIWPVEGTAATLLDKVTETIGLNVDGGIAVVDGDRSINPSCSCGLYMWRGWLDVLDTGVSPFMGHDPAPGIEMVNGCPRVWSDSEALDRAFSIDFTREEFSTQLSLVRRSLEGFLSAVEEWAIWQGYPGASSLRDTLDEAFLINDS